MDIGELKVALLTNHPICVPLVWELERLVLRYTLASFSEGDLIEAELSNRGVNRTVPNLGFEGDWRHQCERWIEAGGADLLCVLSWPKRLPVDLIQKFPLGVWNFHLGLLPEYRGADSIFWQIASGEANGALTIHQMDGEFDTGRIFKSYSLPLAGKSYGAHLEDISSLAPRALEELLQQISRGGIDTLLTPQNETVARSRPKPGLKDTLIFWERYSAEEVYRLVLACNPLYSGAKAQILGCVVQIYEAQVSTRMVSGAPGDVECSEVDGLTLVCADSTCLRVDVVGDSAGIFTGVSWARLRGIGQGLS